MGKKNIVFVGFMGTGKSAVAKKTAKALNMQWLDLDGLIEQRQKRRICDIFAQHGEEYFRRLEKDTVEFVSSKENTVISTGGGVVLNKINMDNLKKNGLIICLTATPDKILERTKGSKHRPLLNTPNPEEKIKALLNARAPYYAQADYTINTSKLAVDKVVGEVVKIWQKEDGKH